jgi:NAD(P)-dependent dehydrogenase (short-subunit alcohol dehydrogenase family)
MHRRGTLSSILMLALLAGGGAVARAQAGTPQKAVLVTGASSGIGRKIAEVLAGRGYFVYAGARKKEDLEALAAIKNLQAVRLDVTVDAEIAAAVETVRKGGRGLHGLVNNAGVGIVGPLIETDDKDLTWLFDVNVYGPYRMAKAFAPLLIESRGRIANISSISGILSGPLLGAYSMSKHALEAFGDALGAEMSRFGIRVSTVEPGNYKSDIGMNVLARMGDLNARATGSRFETEIRSIAQSMGGYDRYPEPDEVAEAVHHALFDPSPRARYMVVPAARQAEITIRKQIEELAQLNHGHRFSIPRDSLVKLLDEALARVN